MSENAEQQPQNEGAERVQNLPAWAQNLIASLRNEAAETRVKLRETEQARDAIIEERDGLTRQIESAGEERAALVQEFEAHKFSNDRRDVWPGHLRVVRPLRDQFDAEVACLRSRMWTLVRSGIFGVFRKTKVSLTMWSLPSLLRLLHQTPGNSVSRTRRLCALSLHSRQRRHLMPPPEWPLQG